jgi:hypothetical protein
MNLTQTLTAKDSGGLFELNAEGTVVYSRLRRKRELFAAEPGTTGCNFFDEVAAFENVDDFRRRFMYFVKGSNPVESFNFDFRFEEDAVPMRVMLVRVSETENNEHTNLVIVDIRKI